jgi:hypothetical protein
MIAIVPRQENAQTVKCRISSLAETSRIGHREFPHRREEAQGQAKQAFASSPVETVEAESARKPEEDEQGAITAISGNLCHDFGNAFKHTMRTGILIIARTISRMT